MRDDRGGVQGGPPGRSLQDGKRPAPGSWWPAINLFLAAAVVIVAAGVSAYRYEQNLQHRQVQAIESHSLDTATRVIQARLGGIASDLRILADGHILGHFLDDPTLEHRNELNHYFGLMLQQKGRYDQVRLLDPQGRERIRVELRDGRAATVPESGLQDKSARYYYRETLRLAPGEIYVSPFDLNVERGVLEQPLKPMLRFVTPVFEGEGRLRGIVILNYLGTDLRRLMAERNASPYAVPMLLNAEGYWLFGPRPEDEWGFMLGHQRRFQADYPDVWRQLSGPAGQVMHAGSLFTYHRVSPTDALISGHDDFVMAERDWVLMSVVDAATFSAQLLPARQRILVVCGVLLLVSAMVAGGYGITRRANLLLRQQREQIREEFVAKVSHELRTPMTAIIGTIKLLLGGVAGEPDPRSKPLLDILSRNSLRLLNLINDLLDLQRAKLGELEFSFQPLDIVGLVRDTLAADEPVAATRGIRLALGGISDGIQVQGDPMRLGQVLTNLVANAIKFSPEGSLVQIQIALLDGRVRVDVADQGPGVPDDFRAQIFSEFAQADHGDTRRPGGSGLGLAISRTIIERHQGQIGFFNRPEGGAVFYFELPLLMAAAAPA